MIKIVSIEKRYKNFKLSINNIIIRKGDIVFILGPNGSGKTTLLNILATLIRPDYCNVKIFDLDLLKDYKKIRRIIGYVMHDFNLYESLTVRENIELISMLNINAKDMRELPLVKDFMNKKFGELSFGQKKLVSIVKELIKNPKVLLLDEAFSGLDIYTRNLIAKIVEDYAKKMGIVLVTTHNVQDLYLFSNCKYLTILNGRNVYYGNNINDAIRMMNSRQTES